MLVYIGVPVCSSHHHHRRSPTARSREAVNAHRVYGGPRRFGRSWTPREVGRVDIIGVARGNGGLSGAARSVRKGSCGLAARRRFRVVASSSASQPYGSFPQPGPDGDFQQPGRQNIGVEKLGLQSQDFSALIYGSAAFYLPVVVYGVVSLALAFSHIGVFPWFKPIMKVVLENMRMLSRVHHALLDIAFCCAIIPALRVRVPRFVRDHLLEASFMAPLALDVIYIFLAYGSTNLVLHATTYLLSVAVILLGIFSIRSALQINLVDQHDTALSYVASAIFAFILGVLGCCTRDVKYFLFLALLVWLRWQRFKQFARRRAQSM